MVTFTGDDVRALFSHPAHQHGLKLVATDKLFQCDGCKQIGDELRYRCEQCDFDLHEWCAQAPASIEHSMFENRVLTFFHSRPATATHPGGIISGCDVCAEPVQGFLYHNSEHDVDLHPFCAHLPVRIVQDEGRVMELHKATGQSCRLCGEVGHRSRCLAYRLKEHDGETEYVHVACFMEAKYSSSHDDVGSTTTEKVNTCTTLATVQDAPRRRSKFRIFCKVAFRVAKVSYSVATLDPVGVVTAIVCPI